MKSNIKILISLVVSLVMVALSACSYSGGKASESNSSGENKIKIAMIPKVNGIPYYQAVKRGVDEAAKELGDSVEVIWNGPSKAEAAKQVEIIENMINAKVDVIAVAANDPAAVAPALEKAKNSGIKVVSWDGDANVRDIFVELVDPDLFGASFVDLMVQQIGESGKTAIVTSEYTAPNQSAWIDGINKYIEEKKLGIDIVSTVESGEDQQRAMDVTRDLIQANPDIKGIFAITTAALPGAAQAVESLGKSGEVHVVGNSTPNAIRQYFDSGTLTAAQLWNPADHGYLTVYTALALARGDISEGEAFEAGRLGNYEATKDDISLKITLGDPLVFTKENISEFDF